MSDDNPDLEARVEPEEAVPSAPGSRRDRGVAIGLAVVLLLVLALVGTAPFWAPSLPWGGGADRQGRELSTRLDRLDAAQAKEQQQLAALAARPAPSLADIADLRQQLAKLADGTGDLAKRVEALDNAGQDRGARFGEVTRRLDAVEKAAQDRAATLAELGKRVAAAEQAGAAQKAGIGDLAKRVEAAEAALKTQVARDSGDAAMALVLLQIRDAVAAGRPFAAEYDTLAHLARSTPQLAEAAAPLAEPAKTGVASRAVLARQLRQAAGAIANAGEASGGGGSASGWTDAVLARLRGLVTIRRTDGKQQSAANAAASAAELALAGGDLAGAVAALDKLTGAPAAAAKPWLDMARQRLAVETALHRLGGLLTERLGSPAPPPAAAAGSNG